MKILWLPLGLFLLAHPRLFLLPEPEIPTAEVVIPTREIINDRLQQAVGETKSLKVVYEDILGEGKGFDRDPRFVIETVNCIIWIREVISRVYGVTHGDRHRVMDQLRYYHGKVGFSLRKHFTSRWLSLDPAPFRRKSLDRCAKPAFREVELDLDRFKDSLNYQCDLYREDLDEFRIDYVRPKDLVRCSQSWEPGYYFLFAIASDSYNRVFGKKSGPMGLVHGMILEIRMGIHMIHHASITTGKVETETVQEYVSRMEGRRHLGYQVYELDPQWDFSSPPLPHNKEDIQELLRCEAERYE